MNKLDTTTRKLQILLAGTVSTTACDWTVSYRDENRNAPQSLGAVPSATMVGTVSSVTAVDLLSAPSVNTVVRVPERISFMNRDVSTHTATFRLNDNATTYQYWSPTLLTGESAFYDEGRGWYALDANGNEKISGISYSEGAWTPVDASGAGLAFTGAAGTWEKIGRQVTARFTLTYPATADASVAIIGGLPFTVANSLEARQGFISITGETTAQCIFPTSAATTIAIRTNSNGNITNATMSGDLLVGTAIYYV